MPARTNSDEFPNLWKTFAKMLTVVSLSVGMMGLAGSIGTYFVMQYRVEATETEFKAFKGEVTKDLATVRADNYELAKMMIRLEERIKSLQRANGISTE